MLGCAVDDDDEAAGGVDVQRLPVDPASLEGTIVAGPPLIAVTRTWARRDLRARRLRKPVLGNDRRPIDARPVEDELTETAIVAQRDREAAAALLVTHLVDHPFGVALHAVGSPDLFGQVISKRRSRRLGH